MGSYKIGFYNSRIENIEGLEHCDRIFDNFEELKFHIRENDEVIVKSGFSLYEIDTRELFELIDKYSLNVHLSENLSLRKNTNIMSIQMLMGINDYIRSNLDIIKKL